MTTDLASATRTGSTSPRVRAAPGEGMLRHRHERVAGAHRAQRRVGGHAQRRPTRWRCASSAHDTLSVPPGAWRSIVKVVRRRRRRRDRRDQRRRRTHSAGVGRATSSSGRERRRRARRQRLPGAVVADPPQHGAGLTSPLPRAYSSSRRSPSASLCSPRALVRDRREVEIGRRQSTHLGPASATGQPSAADDRRALGPALAALGAGAVAAGDGDAVHPRRGHGDDDLGGTFAGGPVDERPVRRHGDQVGARQGEVAGDLGELEVVADRRRRSARRACRRPAAARLRRRTTACSRSHRCVLR